MNLRRFFLLFGLIGVLNCNSVQAFQYQYDCEPDCDSCCFNWEVGTYLWLTTFKGDALVNGNSVRVDVDLVDLLEESDSLAVFVAASEMSYGPWTVLVDFQYADLGFKGLPVIPVATADLDFSLILATALLRYRFICCNWGPCEDSIFSVDAFVGCRYSRYKIDVALSTGPQLDVQYSWADPLVGLSSALQLNECWGLILAGNVGGFDVGSKFSWAAKGGIIRNWSWRCMSGKLLFLYRAIGQDYEKDALTAYDVTQHGPLLGIVLDL